MTIEPQALTSLEDCPTIDLNDLPFHSPWPARLLSVAFWSIPNRDQQKVEAEYNRDKYQRCLAYFQENPSSRTMEDVKRFELGQSAETAEICVSDAEQLRRVPLQRGAAAHFAHIVHQVFQAAQGCKSIVSLGCGYGYILEKLSHLLPTDVQIHGGEIATSAVELAQLLFAREQRVKVRPFNFYNREDYDFLAELPAPILVYTSHAVEQLPSALPFIENLRGHAACLGGVLCCEPVVDAFGNDLLGLLRRRYVEANDYNRDLGELLRTRPEIRHEILATNVFGINPLNPTTFVRWNYQ